MTNKRPLAAPSWMRPAAATFKRDPALDRLLWWRKYRPKAWADLSSAMHAEVERYEQAKREAGVDQ